MPTLPSNRSMLAVCGALLFAAVVAITALPAAVSALTPLTTQFAAPAAHANGRVVEFDRRIAGPYEIALGKIPPTPFVGNLYLSILITDTATETPLVGANVVVSATGPAPAPENGETDASQTANSAITGGETTNGETGSKETANGETTTAGPVTEIGPITVDPDPDTENYPGYYDTAEPIVLETPGMWMFTVSVDAPEAETAAAVFPVEVTTPNPLTGIVTLVALIAFIIVVALAIRMYIRERRRSKQS